MYNMAKLVDVVVLGGRTRAVSVERTDSVATALEKAGVCPNGYDIFDQNGEALKETTPIGDTTQISLTKQVKGNSCVVNNWYEKHKLELAEEREKKANEIIASDPLQKKYKSAVDELTAYITENKIKDIAIPKFTDITKDTQLALKENDKVFDEKEDELRNTKQELLALVVDLGNKEENTFSILVARGVIDDKYNIL